MTTEKLNTKWISPEIRCSYPHLAEKTEDLSGRLAYTLSIPLPKSEEQAVAALREVMSNAAVNEWGPKAKDLKGITHYVEDGDEEDEIYKGTLKFTAKSQKRRPGCVFPNLKPVPEEQIEEKFYPGCFIRASVNAYATEAGGRKTIAFSLNNVLWVRDGERIGGGSNADDDFGDFADPAFTDDPFSNNADAPDIF